MKRMSIRSLLTVIIVGLSVMTLSCLTWVAWGAWVASADSARVQRVAAVSVVLDRAYGTLRASRSAVTTAWRNPAPLAGEAQSYLADLTRTETAALRDSMDLLGSVAFPGQDRLPELRGLVDAHFKRRAEFWANIDQPGSSRRAALADEDSASGLELIDRLAAVAKAVLVPVERLDADVDRLLRMKQAAMAMRTSAGGAALVLTDGLRGSFPVDGQQRFARFTGATDTYWADLMDATESRPLPPAIQAAMEKVKSFVFGDDYVSTKNRMLAALSAGKTSEMTLAQWPRYTVAKMQPILSLAEIVTDEAAALATRHRDEANARLLLCVALLVTAVLASIGGGVVIGRRVIGPLAHIRDAMLRLAGGDLTVKPPYLGRGDEIGALAGALDVFLVNARQAAAIADQQAAERSQRDGRAGRLEAMVAGFQTAASGMAAELAENASKLEATAKSMTGVAEGAGEGVTSLAAAAAQANAGIQSVAAAAEELSVSIGAIGSNVMTSAGIAGQAVEEAKRADAIVGALAERAQRIGAVVDLISSIAVQTNLLALNATIEAARAGDAGKGFAVVAAEVKTLAVETARATEEIGEQIDQIRSATTKAVTAIALITETIRSISGITTEISASVTQQGAATTEITRNMQQTADATRSMTDTIEAVSRAANDTGAAAGMVLGSAGAVSQQAERLSSEVDSFSANLLAA